MTPSNGNIFHVISLLFGKSPVNGEFPIQRPVTWSFDVFFDLRLNQQLNKQWRCQWFEMPSCSLCQCNALIWACYTETDHFPATRIIELFSHRVLLLCKSNCIAAQNPVEHTVCVGLGVVVVNTGNAEVTRLLNEAHAENPHHRSLWSQSTPCLICMVRHTNNTFSWPQKILRYSWPVMFNCRIICCHNIFGQPAVIIRSTPDTTDFFNVPWLYYACQNGMGGYIFGIDCNLMASLQSWCKSA